MILDYLEGGIKMNEPFTAQLFLCTNEHMQIQLTGQRLEHSLSNEFRFSVTADCVLTTAENYGRKFPLNLIVKFSKKNSLNSIQLDLVNLPNISPLDFQQLAENIQGSPAFFQLMVRLFNDIIRDGHPEDKQYAMLIKNKFIDQHDLEITNFSSNRLSKNLFWLYRNDHLIWNISPFTIDEAGGHVGFSVLTGFTNESFMQTYEIQCLMHIFSEGDKLGYYFELYLDESDYLHKRLYEELPDRFMLNKKFLERILTLMENCDAKGYEEYLNDLIFKFNLSI